MKNLEKYKRYLRSQELSAATIAVYTRVAAEFLSYKGNAGLDKALVLAYKEQLEHSSLSATTINQHIVAVNRFLRYCGREDCVVKTKRIQRHSSISNVINDTDYRRLLACAKERQDDKYYAIMKTLALTGIRVSELAYITVENMGDGHILVYNKGKLREIFLPDCLLGILRAYCERHHITEGCIFRGNRGKPISRAAVWKKINRMADDAGVDRAKAHPHSFRHYFALLYLKRYSNLFELADILGHESLETTRIYAVATAEEKRERMGRLDTEKIDRIQYSVENVKDF